MEIFRRPPDPEAVQFADLLDAMLAPNGAKQAAEADESTQRMLQVAVAARNALQVAPARPAREAARRAMLNHAANRATGANGPFQLPGFATAGALSAAVMLASLFGTVNAAEAALPGDLLYPLKGALEDTLIALTPSEAARLQLKIDFANRRVVELEALNEQQRTITVDLLERTAEQIQDVVTASRALPADAPQKRQVSSVGRKSLEVLTDVSERVPEPAKQGLQNAIAASQQAEAAAPPPSTAPAPVVRSDGARPASTATPTVSPTATAITLLPSRSGPERRAADRSGATSNGRGNDDDNQRGRPAPTVTPKAEDRDDRNNGRGGRDDDDRGRQPTAVPGRAEPEQDGGRGSGPSRPPVAGEPTQTGGRPGPTAGPPALAPVTPPVATPASAEPRRTRPDDDDDDDRRRPAVSPTPQPRNEDENRGGPGRGGRDDRDEGPRATATPPRPAPTAPPPPPPPPPTAAPASPTPVSSGPTRSQRDNDDNSGRNPSNDNRPDPRRGDDRDERDARGGGSDDGRKRGPQPTPTPEPPRGGPSGPQRGRN